MEQEVPLLFSKRLQRARKQAGISQARLAEYLGVSTRMVTYYESGAKMPPLNKLPLIARSTRRDIEWFFRDVEPDSNGGRAVPLFEEVPAGPTADAVPQVQGSVVVPAHWAAGDVEVYCLRVRGRSMEPTIVDGDVIVVRRQPEGEHGQIVVASVPGTGEASEFTVKRLSRRGHDVTLRSDNPAYADIVPQGPLKIEGRVVGLIRDL